MMIEEGNTKIVNFMTPEAEVLALGCGYVSYIVKLFHFFKNVCSLLLSVDQKKEYIVMMSQGGFTKIIFLAPKVEVLCYGVAILII